MFFSGRNGSWPKRPVTILNVQVDVPCLYLFKKKFEELVSVIESLYNKSTSTACPTITMVSNNCQSSLTLYLVSKPEILLEQTKTNALGASLVLLQSKGADNIDLIAGSKGKLTDLTSRLTYQHIDVPWKYGLKRATTWSPPG